jgi:hypothetical protein
MVSASIVTDSTDLFDRDSTDIFDRSERVYAPGDGLYSDDPDWLDANTTSADATDDDATVGAGSRADVGRGTGFRLPKGQA